MSFGIERAAVVIPNRSGESPTMHRNKAKMFNFGWIRFCIFWTRSEPDGHQNTSLRPAFARGIST